MCLFTDMAESRAEIQKVYRQRLKDRNNDLYLTRERLRRTRSYVPNNQFSKKEKAERNQKNRDYLKQYRQRKKAAAQIDVNNAENQEERAGTCTSGYESPHSSALSPAIDHASQNRMLIRMNFGKLNGPKMSQQRDEENRERCETSKREIRCTATKIP